MPRPLFLINATTRPKDKTKAHTTVTLTHIACRNWRPDCTAAPGPLQLSTVTLTHLDLERRPAHPHTRLTTPRHAFRRRYRSTLLRVRTTPTSSPSCWSAGWYGSGFTLSGSSEGPPLSRTLSSVSTSRIIRIILESHDQQLTIEFNRTIATIHQLKLQLSNRTMTEKV